MFRTAPTRPYPVPNRCVRATLGSSDRRNVLQDGRIEFRWRRCTTCTTERELLGSGPASRRNRCITCTSATEAAQLFREVHRSQQRVSSGASHAHRVCEPGTRTREGSVPTTSRPNPAGQSFFPSAFITKRFVPQEHSEPKQPEMCPWWTNPSKSWPSGSPQEHPGEIEPPSARLHGPQKPSTRRPQTVH